MAKPDFPILTERLVPRPCTMDDLDAVHAWQSLPEVARYLYWSARTREESRIAPAEKELVYALLDDEFARVRPDAVNRRSSRRRP